MLSGLVPIAIIVWVLLQTRESRARVWRGRRDRAIFAFGPIARRVYWDVRATRQWHTKRNYRLVYHSWRLRRSLRQGM